MVTEDVGNVAEALLLASCTLKPPLAAEAVSITSQGSFPAPVMEVSPQESELIWTAVDAASAADRSPLTIKQPVSSRKNIEEKGMSRRIDDGDEGERKIDGTGETNFEMVTSDPQSGNGVR